MAQRQRYLTVSKLAPNVLRRKVDVILIKFLWFVLVEDSRAPLPGRTKEPVGPFWAGELVTAGHEGESFFAGMFINTQVFVQKYDSG
jgi:hypothetical protein